MRVAKATSSSRKTSAVPQSIYAGGSPCRSRARPGAARSTALPPGEDRGSPVPEGTQPDGAAFGAEQPGDGFSVEAPRGNEIHFDAVVHELLARRQREWCTRSQRGADLDRKSV